jgi:hypothetical protein
MGDAKNSLSMSLKEEQKKSAQCAVSSNILPRLTEEACKRIDAKIIDIEHPGPKGCRRRWGGAHSHGYPRVSLGGKNEGVHRIQWVRVNRVEIPAGREIAHTCDERGCLDNDHHVLKSHPENMATVTGGPMSKDEFHARCSAHKNHEPVSLLHTEAAIAFLERVWAEVNDQRGFQVSAVDTQDRNRALRPLLSSGEKTATLALVYMVKNWAHFTGFAEHEYAVFGYSKPAPARPVLAVLRSTAGRDAALNFFDRAEKLRAEVERMRAYKKKQAERAAKEAAVERDRRLSAAYAVIERATGDHPESAGMGAALVVALQEVADLLDENVYMGKRLVARPRNRITGREQSIYGSKK